MSVPRNQAGGRRKSRASQACLKCRQRKIKCINSAPGQPCESCRTLQITCTVSEYDGRRYSNREQWHALQARLQRVESAIVEQTRTGVEKRHSPVRKSGRSPTGSTVCPNAQYSDAIQGIPIENATVQSDVASSDGKNGEMDTDCNIIAQQQAIDIVPSRSKSFSHPQPDSAFENLSDTSQRRMGLHRATIEPFRDYLGDMLHTKPRLDSEHGDHLNIRTADGQSSYYGPTSHSYVNSCEPDILESIEPKPHLSTTELKLSSAPCKNFLLQIFFRAQSLSTPVVDQALFEAGRVRGMRAQWYSNFLENAMLACATRMSTSQDFRRSGDQYVLRAKQEFLDEIGDPNNATLQGLLLLSDFEATRGRNRMGSLYCGLACRLVFDLGLTASCTTLITRGLISQADAFERHRLLLATHVYDKLWSVYMGRPSAIPNAMVAAAHERLLSEGWKGSITAEHWAGLCTDISDATELLLINPDHKLNLVNRLQELSDRITLRFNRLPPELLTSLDQTFELIPAAFALHIQFHGARIVAQGLLKKTIQAAQTNTPLSRPQSIGQEQHRVEQAAQSMLDDAIAIARLMSTYHNIYGVENIVTIMLDNMYVASGVLVSFVLHGLGSQDPGVESAAYAWLRTLRDILHAARKHYPVATRMCCTLSKTVRKTVIHGLYDCALLDHEGPKQSQAANIGASHQTPFSDVGTFRSVNQTAAGPMYDFDNDPMLGDIFGEIVSAEPTGNLMDWLSLGLGTETSDMSHS